MSRALGIARQVAVALDAAHTSGILHRDIKPHNVMLDDEGVIKVMDFGLARISDASVITTTGQMLGTPAYMAPEQCLGKESDHRADIYSLGVLLYEMLAGRVPFLAETPIAVVMKALEESPPPIGEFRDDVPESVTHIIAKAMAKNMGSRYPSAKAMVDDLDRAIAGQPVEPADEDADEWDSVLMPSALERARSRASCQSTS